MVLPYRAAAAMLALMPLPALATPEPQGPETPEAPEPDGDIVVVATRIRGGVQTAAPPTAGAPVNRPVRQGRSA